jgi:hypothetical protein
MVRLEEAMRDLIERLMDALEPLAALEVPEKPQGNAGAYSIRHADIKAAKLVLAEARAH